MVRNLITLFLLFVLSASYAESLLPDIGDLTEGLDLSSLSEPAPQEDPAQVMPLATNLTSIPASLHADSLPDWPSNEPVIHIAFPESQLLVAADVSAADQAITNLLHVADTRNLQAQVPFELLIHKDSKLSLAVRIDPPDRKPELPLGLTYTTVPSQTWLMTPTPYPAQGRGDPLVLEAVRTLRQHAQQHSLSLELWDALILPTSTPDTFLIGLQIKP